MPHAATISTLDLATRRTVPAFHPPVLHLRTDPPLPHEYVSPRCVYAGDLPARRAGTVQQRPRDRRPPGRAGGTLPSIGRTFPLPPSGRASAHLLHPLRGLRRALRGPGGLPGASLRGALPLTGATRARRSPAPPSQRLGLGDPCIVVELSG